MGLRGVYAKTKKQRLKELDEAERFVNYWEAPWLSRAEKVISFCEDMTISSGKFAFTKMQLRSWQKDFINAVYRTRADRVRPVRTAVLSMGRKNGKTQLAAALALCHLSGPESENRGEVYACANDRFQAGKIFNEMCAMIDNNKWLSSRTNIIRFRKDIHDLINDSIYATLTAEAKTKMGLSPSFVVYDELGQADSRELYDAMDSAMGARKDPLLMVISTQASGDGAPLSQLIDYGLQVNSGKVADENFHLTFYAADTDADPWDEATWLQANPALNDFRSLEDLQRMAAQAQRMPSLENSFRNLILNQRIAAEERFIRIADWDACNGTPNIPEGAKVFAGLDLGATRDMSAFAIAYTDGSNVTHVVPFCWLPGNPRDRGNEDRQPYDVWVRDGYLSAIGIATNPGVIAHKIAEVNGRNPIEALGFDPWKFHELERELDAIGCRIPLVKHGQGYRDMSGTVDGLERAIAEKRLRHGGHPVLTMAAMNAVVTRDPAGNKKFDKAKSNGRIDPLVAVAMAMAMPSRAEKTPAFDVEALIA
jgi:phage terminase large subunit-like protein